jgi:hypothetical protein
MVREHNAIAPYFCCHYGVIDAEETFDEQFSAPSFAQLSDRIPRYIW